MASTYTDEASGTSITESGGPTVLTIASIADGELLYRTGATVDGLAQSTFVKTAPAAVQEIALESSATNSITNVLKFRSRSSGTPAAGIGVGLVLGAEDAAGTDQDIAEIRASLTTATAGAEVGAYRIAIVQAGSIPAAGSEQIQFGNGVITLAPAGGSAPVIRFGNSDNQRVYDSGSTLNVDYGGTTRLKISGTAIDLNGHNLAGNSSSGGNATFTSTSNATKGKLYMGSAQTTYFDEATKKLKVVGDTSNQTFSVEATVDLGEGLGYFWNKHAAGASGFTHTNDAGSGKAIIGYFGGSYTDSFSSSTAFRSSTGVLMFGDHTFFVGKYVQSNAGKTYLRCDGATASVIVNDAAIATNATGGFLYVPSCAGTPTGTPTTYTGTVPIVVDSTNNKLYFYSGGSWRDAGP